MRKPKGKLVALLAGAVVVVLVAVGAMFWKDVYCHLFLDPRLVGRWTSDSDDVRAVEFGKVGSATGIDALGEIWIRGTYRIDGSTLIIDWSNIEELARLSYRIEGDSATFDSPANTYRRVPDDS